ncbi:hypothetical protein TanjilG_03447 [Lupinus angustifolius]|uniref:Ubiquitin-conjugating enzyme E2 H n=2 Tax=Lupinus angustifolius TaxID=3871 RepID=A0A1J7G605_LUPAN|nr:hypothetical protein TanjilG_03447 [Lupinus angustifolius]
MSKHKVETFNDELKVFHVHFHGPKDSPYQGGVWKVRVELPDEYPCKSPSIEFINKIYHPNIDDITGSVCLDVIDQAWSPMFDLVNVFEMFLPQLLLYPNELDPLNQEAAALMIHDLAAYELKVKEYCERYAKPSDIGIEPEKKPTDEEITGDENDENDTNDEQEAADKPDP